MKYPKFDSKLFSRNLKLLRESRNYSKYRMSIMIDINYHLYVNIENGIRKPNYPTLIKIANLFQIGLQDLIFDNIPERDKDIKNEIICLIKVHKNSDLEKKYYEILLTVNKYSLGAKYE